MSTKSPHDWPTTRRSGGREPTATYPPATQRLGDDNDDSLRVHSTPLRFSGQVLALVAVVALLTGVGLVTLIALATGGASSGPTRTVHITTTVTVTAPPAGPRVPSLVGMRYDQAKARLQSAGYVEQREGGGDIFGMVLDDTNYNVVAETPAGGTPLPQGSTVRLSIVGN